MYPRIILCPGERILPPGGDFLFLFLFLFRFRFRRGPAIHPICQQRPCAALRSDELTAHAVCHLRVAVDLPAAAALTLQGKQSHVSKHVLDRLTQRHPDFTWDAATFGPASRDLRHEPLCVEPARICEGFVQDAGGNLCQASHDALLVVDD